MQSRSLQCWCFALIQSGMSHEAEIPIPASFRNQFTTFTHVFRTGNYEFLRLKTHLTGIICITFAWLFLTLQVDFYRFSIAELEKIFRRACNVILITGSISTELSYSPSHKVLINPNTDSRKIIMMTVLGMWPIPL